MLFRIYEDHKEGDYLNEAIRQSRISQDGLKPVFNRPVNLAP